MILKIMIIIQLQNYWKLLKFNKMFTNYKILPKQPDYYY